jgi:hypothetical protein
MATSTLITQSQAIKLAQAFLQTRLQRDLPPITHVRHMGSSDLEKRARDLEAGCLGPLEVSDQTALQKIVQRTRGEREHWLVSFRAPDPSGTATTLHATMVRVYDDTGEAEFQG